MAGLDYKPQVYQPYVFQSHAQGQQALQVVQYQDQQQHLQMVEYQDQKYQPPQQTYGVVQPPKAQLQADGEQHQSLQDDNSLLGFELQPGLPSSGSGLIIFPLGVAPGLSDETKKIRVETLKEAVELDHSYASLAPVEMEQNYASPPASPPADQIQNLEAGPQVSPANQIQNLEAGPQVSPACQIQNLDPNHQNIYESIRLSDIPQYREQLKTERQDQFEQLVQHQVNLGTVGGLDEQLLPHVDGLLPQWQQPLQLQQHVAPQVHAANVLEQNGGAGNTDNHDSTR